MTDKERWATGLAFAGLALGLPLAFLLYAPFGITGVAAARIASVAVVAVGGSLVLRRFRVQRGAVGVMARIRRRSLEVSHALVVAPGGLHVVTGATLEERRGKNEDPLVRQMDEADAIAPDAEPVGTRVRTAFQLAHARCA